MFRKGEAAIAIQIRRFPVKSDRQPASNSREASLNEGYDLPKNKASMEAATLETVRMQNKKFQFTMLNFPDKVPGEVSANGSERFFFSTSFQATSKTPTIQLQPFCNVEEPEERNFGKEDIFEQSNSEIKMNTSRNFNDSVLQMFDKFESESASAFLQRL